MDSQVSGFGQKLKNNRFASTLVILATLTLGILIGTVVSAGVKGKEKNSSADATPLQVPSPVKLSNQFSQIARQMEPSVVNINTESTIKNPHGRRMMPPGQDRLALEMKCDGLDAEQLARRSVPPSTMSLLGLVRHMADVERHWFRRVMAQAERAAAVLVGRRCGCRLAGAVPDQVVWRRLARMARGGRLRSAVRRRLA